MTESHQYAEDHPVASAALAGLLDSALGLAAKVSPLTSATFASLRELRSRLAQQRLQLAVLGQFKRGKSTLLNALIGGEVLPMGVLPVTAISTFLEAAKAPALTEVYLDGHVSEAIFETAEALRDRLACLVTEEANPGNRLGLSRVMVHLPSELLQRGVVLIDTPGVGSTFQHNTAAADAVLPASDAALFVVSSDPPITQVEVDYLNRIRLNANHIIVVLNKIDLLGPTDATRAEVFLRKALTEHGGFDDPQVFALSARSALTAKLAGDAAGLEQSGLAALERRLLEFVDHDKADVLQAAIARKAATLVGELAFQAELELQSLRLPLSDLEERRRVFEQAIAGFESERRIVSDLLAADLKRALLKLDEEADRLRSEIGRELERAIEREVANGADVNSAWRALQPTLPDRFEAELNAATQRLRRGLEPVFRAHQDRADRLIDLVRQTAAEIMELNLPAAEASGEFETTVLPYWTTERPEALNPLPPGTFDRLLPRGLRERHARRRAQREIADIALRNVENLRWSMRQNAQDTLRRFGAEVETRFAASLNATAGVMAAAVEQRSGYAAAAETKIKESQAVIAQLRDLEAALNAHGPAQASKTS